MTNYQVFDAVLTGAVSVVLQAFAIFFVAAVCHFSAIHLYRKLAIIRHHILRTFFTTAIVCIAATSLGTIMHTGVQYDGGDHLFSSGEPVDDDDPPESPKQKAEFSGKLIAISLLGSLHGAHKSRTITPQN